MLTDRKWRMNRLKLDKKKIVLDIPKDVGKIIKTLENAGFEAFAVGGCVRDALLSRKPQDWDITTGAKPSDVQKLFRRTIETGIAHGTVTVMMGDVGYEVTTYRIDGEYSDGRHPDKVEFTRDLKEDLKRRDFTINAMAYSEKTGLVDEFGGADDLKNGIIRCVGEAQERFGEDALRILRVVRFRAQLGFEIERNTEDAAAQLSGTLEKVSKERIMIELTKLILSDNPQHLQDVFRLGMGEHIAKNFSKLKDSDFGEVTKIRLLPKQKHLHFSYLLRDFSPEQIVSLLKELKMDNENISRIRTLTAYLPQKLPKSRANIKRLLYEIGNDRLEDLICLKSIGFEGLTEDVSYVIAEKADILEKKEPFTLKELKINGNDLIKTGVKQGPRIKQILHEMLEEVISDPRKNDREILLKMVK